jgi:hypothetical protein
MAKLKRIAARTLLGYTVEQLWDILTGDFILVFDDGEMKTDFRETLYSAYAWDFHRLYPETPLLKRHHVNEVLRGERLGSNTHLQLLGNVMWTVYDHYVGGGLPLYITKDAPSSYLVFPQGVTQQFITVDEIAFRDRLAELVYRITNLMYNDLSYRLEEFVVSLDITHFVEVLSHPKVRAANEALVPTQRSIDETYAIIRDSLTNGTDMPTNPISLAARSKLVNIDQVLQCVSARGFLTDTDSHLFRNPVLRGYAQGLRAFHDSLIESRSAAKSLIFSKTPLQQAEYFSRRLQLMSQIVQRLHPGDCGSTHYALWKVRPPIEERGQVVFPGDLKQMVGKIYLDTDGKLKAIHAGDKHLNGKTLKLRTATNCAHPDPYGICATCFGELSLSVPAGTNIGQMCCTSLAQKSSQNVLSVKHLDGSSVVDGIVLDADSRQYLKVSGDENSYLLADGLKNKKIKLIIPSERASNITDIREVETVEQLHITRVSELTDIGIWIDDGKGAPYIITVDVNLGRRLASMTYPLLHYIRQMGWGVDDRGNYTIDMSKWDWTKPILTLPLKHFNMSDHSRDIASFLESSVERMQERDTVVDPNAALIELFDLVNSKLTVNLAVVDVVQYASMIVSAEKNIYELPKPWTTRRLGVMKLSMANRSLSAAMAFENHREVICSPNSYVETNRPDHPMDGVLMPAEVEAMKGWA